MASTLSKQAVLFVFMLSTLYGLSYYWYMGSGNSIAIEGIDDTDGSIVLSMEADSSFTSLVLGVLDSIMEFVSWLGLFGLVKGTLYLLLPDFIYEPINLFLLRPVGWLTAFIITEWVLNKVRGTSEN